MSTETTGALALPLESTSHGYIVDAKGSGILKPGDASPEESAEIVHRVNLHDELVKQAEHVLFLIDNCVDQFPQKQLDGLREVLRKAKEAH